MAQKKAAQKIYHCDGWYFKNVCPSRGDEDTADIRKDKDGFIRQGRFLCKTMGLSPIDYNVCRHCVEHKHFFRAEPRFSKPNDSSGHSPYLTLQVRV